MKVVFLGTPEFAIEPLRQILNSKHHVLAVVSQPDRETDKKGVLKPTAVKAFALAQGIRVLQYETVSEQGIEDIRALCPDIMVTAAFGQILTNEFLKLAPVYNVHASLLPRYRGSSPIQAAILNGDSHTGVTIMKTVREMDAGDILLQGSLEIGVNEPFYALHDRLSVIGAKLIVEALDKTESGELSAVAQENERATYTKKITKKDGQINWSHSAKSIVRCVRAYNPWPCAYTNLNGDNIKIHSAESLNMNSMSDIIIKTSSEPGEILVSDTKKGLVVKCGEGALKILSLQAPGKRILPTEEFLRGYELVVGLRFTGGNA